MREIEAFEYGSRRIAFTLERRDRTTLEISVEPDASVTVVAPIATPIEEILKRLRRRASWIVRQQTFFYQFMPRTPPRSYVPGETHRYLGRAYRLKVVQSVAQRAKFYRGVLVVEQFVPADQETTEKLVRALYRQKARDWLTKRVTGCLAHFADPIAFKPVAVEVRAMRQRWGSLTAKGRLILNDRLIEAPTNAIDYVIIHELCHIQEPNHGPCFFDLLDKVLPSWPDHKLKLELSMI
jgi:predicted metal-dependent hydrolase